MYDLQNRTYCDHRIVDLEVDINGLTPDYYSNLQYTCDGNSNGVEVREYASTEGLSNYAYNLHGMTNWTLSNNNTRISWNTGGLLEGVASFVDGSTLIYPPQKYLITYGTLADSCPKCIDGVSGDINFEGDGSLEIVERHKKIRQLVRKALLTGQVSNAFHEGYGSTLGDAIGTKNTFLKQAMMQKTIQDSLNYIIESQGEETGLPVQDLILRVSDIYAEIDPGNPTQMNIQVTVTNGKYEEIMTGIRMDSK